jgi:hypothetical protein
MCWFSRLLVLLVGLAGFAMARPPADTLPLPVTHEWSFELLSNSRYSTHTGFSDTLPGQVMANVLWAMSRAPRVGERREFYVATVDNVYTYDPGERTLTLHRAGDQRYNSGSAFEVGIAADRPEDVGMAVQAGLLAATAFRTAEGGGVVCCPMTWAADHADARWNPKHTIEMAVVFGCAEAAPLDTVCVAASSDSSLPLPHAAGPDSFESVLADLRQDSAFGPAELSLETISQLLWAAYGVTPHLTYNSRQGLTVPSAGASYPLAGGILLVTREGVERYDSRRSPGNTPATRDHRLERVASGDRRADLTAALWLSSSAALPAGSGDAAAYFVVCVPDTGSKSAMQEAGMVGFQLLCQSRALGLAGFLGTPLSRAQRTRIQSALGLPRTSIPVLVFACGEAARSAAVGADVVRIVRAAPAIRKGQMRLEYLLAQAGEVRVEVFDMLGRPVRLLVDERQSTGYHSATWDGTGEGGARLKRGTYLVVVISRGFVAKHKVTLG